VKCIAVEKLKQDTYL